MNEAIVENLSYLANLVLTYGSTLVIAEGSNILPITAVALILAFLAVRMVKRKHRGFPKSFRARRTVVNKRSSRRLFESQRGPALKACPNCAEQLPLSAIICRTCDYNFLAARPGRGQNLLPSPNP
jgi:ribosomal protein L40E